MTATVSTKQWRPMPPEEALARLATLVANQVADSECHHEFLEFVTRQVAARAGALWHLSPGGVLTLAAQVGLSATDVTRNKSLSQQNIHRLLEVARSSQPACHDDSAAELGFTPRAARLSESEPNPETRGVLMAPILALGRCCGVLEVFFEQLPAANERTSLLEFLAESGMIMSRRQPFCRGAQEDSQSDWKLEQLGQSLGLLHRTLDSRRVAQAAVNEGQRLLGCDRVSLCLARGRRAIPVAVSGQTQINRASAAVRCIARLAEACMRDRQEIRAPETGPAHPPAIQQLLLDHWQAGGGRSVWVVPLAEPGQHNDTGDVGKPLAGMVFESFSRELKEAAPVSTSATFLRHVAQALGNARAHTSIINHFAVCCPRCGSICFATRGSGWVAAGIGRRDRAGHCSLRISR